MTLPYERARSIIFTRDFLAWLAEGGGKKRRFKRVPGDIRKMARACLRHYPTKFDCRYMGAELVTHLKKVVNDLG